MTVEERLSATEQSLRSAHRRIDEIGVEVKDMRALTAAMVETGAKIKEMKEDIGEMKSDIKALSDRPRKWWDKAVGAFIGTVCAMLATSVLALILRQ